MTYKCIHIASGILFSKIEIGLISYCSFKMEVFPFHRFFSAFWYFFTLAY